MQLISWILANFCYFFLVNRHAPTADVEPLLVIHTVVPLVFSKSHCQPSVHVCVPSASVSLSQQPVSAASLHLHLKFNQFPPVKSRHWENKGLFSYRRTTIYLAVDDNRKKWAFGPTKNVGQRVFLTIVEGFSFIMFGFQGGLSSDMVNYIFQ